MAKQSGLDKAIENIEDRIQVGVGQIDALRMILADLKAAKPAPPKPKAGKKPKAPAEEAK